MGLNFKLVVRLGFDLGEAMGLNFKLVVRLGFDMLTNPKIGFKHQAGRALGF